MLIFSIKNEKLNFFNRPIYCESENEALTYIQNVLMSDSDRALSSLKDDLSLYFLGNIDFVTGVITPNEVEYGDYKDGHCPGDIVCEPGFLCSLREIFDTIPEERLKPAVTVENMRYLEGLVDKLSSDIEILKNHKHDKKGGNII